MNLSCRVVKSMSLPGSSVTRKSGGGSVFPAGLRVLVVDDDPTCLTILQKMLQTCGYEVTKTNRAEVALTLLRENRNDFDIVISDVHMPDMDGFKLLERVGLEMDLPVIMMSADDTKTVVMKGVTHGACDYLIKPIRIEELKNIWQHVVRKKKNEWKDLEQSGSWGEVQRQDDAVSSPTSEDGWKSSKRRGEEEESEDKDDSAALKKPRVVWGVELHQQFVAAVNQLGIDKAVPKRILELMNVSGLSRENVASHLQKFRLGLRRANGVSQNQGGLNNSSMPQDSGFPAMSSLGGLDLQELTAPTQFSAQTLAAYSQMPSTVVNAGMSMPFVGQRNLFSSENSKLAYVNGQQEAQLGNVGKQVNLLHGISKIKEPEQIGDFNQSGKTLGVMNMHASSSGSHQTLGSTKKPASSSGSHQTLGGMNMHASSSGSHQALGRMNMHASSSGSHQALGGMNMQASSSGSHQAPGGINLHTSSSSGHQSNSLLMRMIPQQQSSGKILNESQAPLVQSSMGVPPMQSSAVISRNRMAYNPVSQAAAPLVDLPVNRISELPGSGFSLGSTPWLTSMTSKGFLNQEEVCSNIKGTRGYSPNYGVFSELQQHKYQDWQSQNSGMNLGSCSSQHGTCSVNVAPSVLLNQSYVNNQKNEQNMNSFTGKQMFSGILENQQMETMNPNPNLNGPRLVGNPILVKTDIEANLFSEQYGQEDLMSALLKQQEGMSSGEFDFDGYTLDNIPV